MNRFSVARTHPGVSMILIVFPFQDAYVAAEAIVIPAHLKKEQSRVRAWHFYKHVIRSVGILSGNKRRTFLAFKFHAVHFRTNAIFSFNFVDSRDTASVKKNSLGQSGLSRVNMRTNANVSLSLQSRYVRR